jgi:hypothetical protein
MEDQLFVQNCSSIQKGNISFLPSIQQLFLLTAPDWQDQDLFQEMAFQKKTVSQKSKLISVRDLPLIIGLNFRFHKKGGLK